MQGKMALEKYGGTFPGQPLGRSNQVKIIHLLPLAETKETAFIPLKTFSEMLRKTVS